MIIYLLTLLSVGLGLFMMVSRDLSSLIVFGGILVLLLVLFRVVGAVRLGETLTRLQERYRFSRRQRVQRTAFEHVQLRIRQARNATQWWQTICEAAGRMDFAWIALTTTGGDGRVETERWQSTAAATEGPRVLLVTIPFGESREGARREFEIAICVDGSLEDACRRASLFSRLIDAHGI
jgi:hypothetical protein